VQNWKHNIFIITTFFLVVNIKAEVVNEEIKRRSISSLVQMPSSELKKKFSLDGRIYGSDPINIGFNLGVPLGGKTNLEIGESVRFKDQKLIRTNSRSILLKYLHHPRFLLFSMYDPEFQPLLGTKWNILPDNEDFYFGTVLNFGGDDKPRGLSSLDYNSTKNLLAVIGFNREFENFGLTVESNLKEYTAKLSFADFDLIYESERNHTELVVKGFEFGAGERNKN
jgi:hypothetical protein